MYLVTIIKKNPQICRFYLHTSLCTQVASRCHDFWNKWSWGLCVTPILWITCNMNKLTHITNLAMYLITIIKKNPQICRFYLHTSLCTQVASRCHDFWNKWSWGLCVTPILWITCNMNKLTHITNLAMYLITIIKTKLKFVDFC